MNELNTDVAYDYVTYLYNHKPWLFFQYMLDNKVYWGVISEVLIRRYNDNNELIEFIKFHNSENALVASRINNIYYAIYIIKFGKWSITSNMYLMLEFAKRPNYPDYGLLNKSNLNITYPINQINQAFNIFIEYDNIRYFTYYSNLLQQLENNSIINSIDTKMKLLRTAIKYGRLQMTQMITNTLSDNYIDRYKNAFKSYNVFDTNELSTGDIGSLAVLQFILSNAKLQQIIDYKLEGDNIDVAHYIQFTDYRIIQPDIIQYLLDQYNQPTLDFKHLIFIITTQPGLLNRSSIINFETISDQVRDNLIQSVIILNKYNDDKDYHEIIGRLAGRYFPDMVQTLNDLSTGTKDYTNFIHSAKNIRTLELLLHHNQGSTNYDKVLYKYIFNNRFNVNIDMAQLINTYNTGPHNYDPAMNNILFDTMGSSTINKQTNNVLFMLIAQNNRGARDYTIAINKLLKSHLGNVDMLRILITQNTGDSNYYDIIEKIATNHYYFSLSRDIVSDSKVLKLLLQHNTGSKNYTSIINLTNNKNLITDLVAANQGPSDYNMGINRSNDLDIIQILLQHNTGSKDYNQGINHTDDLRIAQLLISQNTGSKDYNEGINTTDNVQVAQLLVRLNRGSKNYAAGINRGRNLPYIRLLINNDRGPQDYDQGVKSVINDWDNVEDYKFATGKRKFNHEKWEDWIHEQQRAQISQYFEPNDFFDEDDEKFVIVEDQLSPILDLLVKNNRGSFDLTTTLNYLNNLKLVAKFIPINRGRPNYDHVMNHADNFCDINAIKTVHQANTAGWHDYVELIEKAYETKCYEILIYVSQVNKAKISSGVVNKILLGVSSLYLFKRLVTIYSKQEHIDLQPVIAQLVTDKDTEKLPIVLQYGRYNHNLHDIMLDLNFTKPEELAIGNMLQTYHIPRI